MDGKNGTLWKWAIGVIVTLSIVAVTGMNALGVFQGETKKQAEHNHEAIIQIKAKDEKQDAARELNTQYRWQDEKETEHVNEKMDLLRMDFGAFRTEQRAVNKEILQKLNTLQPPTP